jgi:hypothetical protein
MTTSIDARVFVHPRWRVIVWTSDRAKRWLRRPAVQKLGFWFTHRAFVTTCTASKSQAAPTQ